MLRLEAVRNPHDKALIELVGELSTRSDLFRKRWASQDVLFHRSGRKRLRHPVVGQLDLDFESMELPSEPELQLNIYTAAAGTPTADALKLLASWAASQEDLPTEANPVTARQAGGLRALRTALASWAVLGRSMRPPTGRMGGSCYPDKGRGVTVSPPHCSGATSIRVWLSTHWCPNGSSMVACRSPYSQSCGGSTKTAPRATPLSTTRETSSTLSITW